MVALLVFSMTMVLFMGFILYGFDYIKKVSCSGRFDGLKDQKHPLKRLFFRMPTQL